MDDMTRKLSETRKKKQSGGRPVTRRVFVRGLELEARIGAFDHEKDRPQTIRIHIAAETDAEADSTDPLTGMDRVVRYDRLVDGIKSILAEGHFELVETLADRIAKMMLDHGPVRRAEVRIEKPSAIEEADAAGAEVVWEKPHRTGVNN